MSPASRLLVLMYTTVASAEEARLLATGAVALHLAACVNIQPGIIALYEWQGVLEESPEVVIIFKTAQSRAGALRKYLEERHPYKVPAIIQWEATINSLFSDFVSEATR